MRKNYLLIGDKLDRDHGENRCRSALAAQLERMNHPVLIAHKFSCLALTRCDVVVLLPGAGKWTWIFELLIIQFHRLRRTKPVVWYHNASFQRWQRILAFFDPAGRITQLCIQRQQASQGKNACYFPNFVRSGTKEIGGRRKRLLWLSRLEKEKGVDVAFETWINLRESDPEWEFWVIGPNGDWPSPAPMPPGMVMLGRLDGQEKFEALASGGIFIFPSRYSNETQPLVVIEAMAVGLPVVISEQNGIHEVVGIDGRISVTNPLDVDGFVDAVKQSYLNWDAMSVANRKLYQSEYSEDSFQSRVGHVLDAMSGDAC